MKELTTEAKIAFILENLIHEVAVTAARLAEDEESTFSDAIEYDTAGLPRRYAEQIMQAVDDKLEAIKDCENCRFSPCEEHE